MADGFFCDTCGTCVCVCVCVLWLSHLFVSLQLCVLCVHFGEGTSTVVGFVPCTSAQTVPQAPGAQILRLSQSMAANCIKVPRLLRLCVCVSQRLHWSLVSRPDVPMHSHLRVEQ